MAKSPEMQRFINEFSQELFGRTNKGKFGQDICVSCGSELVGDEDFRDDISRKEYTISHMCQTCQDGVFS